MITYEMTQRMRAQIAAWSIDPHDSELWQDADTTAEERTRTLLFWALEEFGPVDFADLEDLAGAMTDAGHAVSHEQLSEVVAGTMLRRQGGSYDILIGPKAAREEWVASARPLLLRILAENGRPMGIMEMTRAFQDQGQPQCRFQMLIGVIRALVHEGRLEKVEGGSVVTYALSQPYASGVPEAQPAASPAPSLPSAPAQRDDDPVFSPDHGWLNAEIVCPHCQKRGRVYTKAVKKDEGISGGKATAGILTGGLSLLVTGLSRKESRTRAHCANCRSVWYL